MGKEMIMKRGGKCLILFMACLYLLAGAAVFRDYGVSTDEPNERRTMYINANYVLTLLGKESMDVPELDSYEDKYYGIFLQMPTAVFEIGSKGWNYIYTWRHLYTFGICVLGYIAFYFLRRKIFASDLTAFLGTAMIALYPRFFAEQFYNIKDMLFVAVYIFAMWGTCKVIESKFDWKWVVIFAFLSALATNVRIVGIIFVPLLTGYAWLVCLTERMNQTEQVTASGESVSRELTTKRALIFSVLVFLLYFLFLVMMYPVAWAHPIRTMIEIFAKFSNYDDWTGAIVFMGKILSKEEVPWYYIPVWMLITVPIWYILLFLLTMGISFGKLVFKIKQRESWYTLLFQYKYFFWAVLLVLIPWGAIVVKHATLYSGWRHCYFLVPPLVLVVLYGVNHIMKRRGKGCKIPVFAFIALGLVIQMNWIRINHPHEMVYFNGVGKNWAADFDRDYWHMAEGKAYDYILENDHSDRITVDSTGTRYPLNFLTEEQRQRFEITAEDPMYFIETYRGKLGNEIPLPGYNEIYSVTVDDFKIITVYKREGL